MNVRRTPLLLLALFLLAPVLAWAAPGDASHGSLAHQRIGTILDTLNQTRSFTGVAMSPDGSTLAWIVDRAKGEGTDVQLARADGSHVRDVSLPGDPHETCKTSELAFSPDGRRLAILSDCGARFPGQKNILIADARAAHPKAHQVSRLEGLVKDMRWAPDGRTLGILYVMGDRHEVEAHSPVKPRVGLIGEAGIEHQQFGTINAVSGELHLVTPKSVFVYEYGWAPDSRAIAFIGAPPPGRDNWWVAKLYTQRVDAASPTVRLDPTTAKGGQHGMQIALPRYAPDGKQIALIGGLMSDQGVTGGDIYLVPASGGPARNVTPGIGFTPSWLTWTGKRRLLVSAIAGGDSRIVSMQLNPAQPAAAATTANPAKPATWHTLLDLPASIKSNTMMSSLAVDATHRHVAFIRSTFTQPPEVYTASLAQGAGQPRAVTDVNAGLAPIWGKQRSITWHNEGFRVQGWLLLPAHYDPTKTYPMVVKVHGGPAYAFRPSWSSASDVTALSAMGYFVLMPNPRGSYGQGEKFTRANIRDFGYGDTRDILAGVDAVEKQYPVDDKRLGLTGWSYGGFMSMFVPTQTRRFAAAVAGAGIANWQSYYGENSIDAWMIPFFGASVYDDPAVYAKSSAITFIKKDTTPTLILVGQYDGECPAPQSFEMWHALKTLGVPTQLMVYPGEGHGLSDPKHRRDAVERTLGWFDTYLGSGNKP